MIISDNFEKDVFNNTHQLMLEREEQKKQLSETLDFINKCESNKILKKLLFQIIDDNHSYVWSGMYHKYIKKLGGNFDKK